MESPACSQSGPSQIPSVCTCAPCMFGFNDIKCRQQLFTIHHVFTWSFIISPFFKDVIQSTGAQAQTENERWSVPVLLGWGSDCCLCVLIRLLSVQIAASAQAAATGMPPADRCSGSGTCPSEWMFSLPGLGSHTVKIKSVTTCLSTWIIKLQHHLSITSFWK